MKYRYSKYIGDPLDEIDIEDLVSKLSDLLLSSGFGTIGTLCRAARDPARSGLLSSRSSPGSCTRIVWPSTNRPVPVRTVIRLRESWPRMTSTSRDTLAA